ncbi:carbon storage regulator [Pseudomonas aeruginosa]|uniref:carbon storage regulator CsrA n=1 Tax=Pseudomonas aeruginosa TaxID=287 RepID=UPI000FCC0A7E|nr:carbon storage regulator [Pseudomonas aeruginosa]RUE10555.1 carbon storage regulator [Pseudomonas aeruginosa]
MLILTRRHGQTLHIGDNITVTVLGSQGDQVRLGITAPDDVAIHRSEIYARVGAVRSASPKDLVEEWNRTHPAQVAVEYRPLRDSIPIRTRTLTQAKVSASGMAVIWLEGQATPVLLRNCTAVS